MTIIILLLSRLGTSLTDALVPKWLKLWPAWKGSTRPLVVESDCLALISALRQGSDNRSISRPIISDILHLSSSDPGISFQHTGRLNNCVAHELAKFSVSGLCGGVLRNSIPPCVVRQIANDCKSLDP